MFNVAPPLSISIALDTCVANLMFPPSKNLLSPHCYTVTSSECDT